MNSAFQDGLYSIPEINHVSHSQYSSFLATVGGGQNQPVKYYWRQHGLFSLELATVNILQWLTGYGEYFSEGLK